MRPFASALAFVVALWFIYLTVEVARHVHAWPFN
jgi:hypothetical protein